MLAEVVPEVTDEERTELRGAAAATLAQLGVIWTPDLLGNDADPNLATQAPDDQRTSPTVAG